MAVQTNPSWGVDFPARLQRLWAERREFVFAAGASLFWVATLAAYGAGFAAEVDAGTRSGTALHVALFLLTLVLPLSLFWITAHMARELSRLREEQADIRTSNAQLIEALAFHGPTAMEDVTRAVTLATRATLDQERAQQAAQIEPLSDQIRHLEAAVHKLTAARRDDRAELSKLVTLAVSAATPPVAAAAAPDAATGPATSSGQPSLPLAAEMPEPDAPLTHGDIIRALNFPANADDRAGFAVMRKAMQHRPAALVLRAAEDMLNLLSQEGIYMDDLSPRPTDAAAWRAFASGQRGSAVTGIGAIEDISALTLARGRMKSDEVFRDTALHFQRRFDTLLEEFATGASDRDLLDLADTRTGRAFMILARISGALD
ncbi:hypothetical protein [Oceanomicrobium pacificus]|uniref:Uncharacterized protein n=1 Tax=Oceanomicrobium pacificus TaxID=2692916 RepID=A0A6B0THY2_9RHOB|nr:hypothetical protein [Oceanomicrobium pacificus]MXU64010.1 hypothetical protein [Oceanomicrobium pacificus]